jgi:predicted ABC-type ATPase
VDAVTQKSTKEIHTDNQGRYTSNRQLLHNTIAANLLKGIKSQENPEIIFMGGGTASGKSTVRRTYIKTYLLHGGIGIIDCDDIKKFIPEYEVLKRENELTAADLVHKESGDIAMLILQMAVDARMNILFDATMKDGDWYEQLVNGIKHEGYQAIAVIVHAPLEIAIEREALRAEKTKRHVPMKDIIESHQNVRASFVRLKEKFDAYVLWDNSGRDFEEPTIIEEFLPGMSESKVHDWKKYRDFYAK